MVYIKRKPEFKFDPLNLPKALDFRLATRDLELPEGAKSKFQIKFSKMNRKQLKETAEYLEDMRYTSLNHHNYKMAAYCKAVKEFLDAYLFSLKHQRRI
jgi:hypothetical protein